MEESERSLTAGAPYTAGCVVMPVMRVTIVSISTFGAIPVRNRLLVTQLVAAAVYSR